MPKYLSFDRDAATMVQTLAGGNPILVNSLLRKVFAEQGSQFNKSPAQKVDATLFHDYWEQHKLDLSTLWSGPEIRRMLGMAIEVLEANPSQPILFKETFLDLPNNTTFHHLVNLSPDQLKEVDVHALEPATSELWKNLGVIREQNGKLRANGLWAAVAVARHFQM